MKKTTFPCQVLLAVVLCLAASAVVAENIDFPNDLTNPDRLDASTTANWSEIDGTYSLVAGDRSLNKPQNHGVVTSIGGGSDNSVAAVMADVNGDDNLDYVVANNGGINKAYLHHDDGALTEVNIGSETDVSTSLALGDVDGDGDLDLFVGNAGLVESDDLSNKLYLNDGSGHFSLKQPSALIDSSPPDLDDTRALALGDVDGDGDLDLVVANARQTNKLYLNDGDANFAVVGIAIGSEIDTSTSLVLLDVDGDADLDLIVGNADEVAGAGKINRLYTNDGRGGFSRSLESLGNNDSDATYALALGDVDNDGDDDLVAANKNQINKLYLNRGAGKFDASGTDIGEEIDASSSVVLVDTDSDGDLDLLVGNENQTNKLYLNEGSGQFSSVGIVLDDETDTTKAVCVGDVDGDGDMDLLVVNQGQDHKLYRNGRGGGFVALGTESGSNNGKGGPVNSVAIGDLNNDGFKDVVVGLYNQANKVYLNDGSGGFSAAGEELGFESPADASYSVALGDFNRDGFLDVVVANYEQHNKIYLNDGDGHFPAAGIVIGADDEVGIFNASTPPAYSKTYSVAVADMDRQNGPDIVFGNNNQFNKLYLNNGSGEFPAIGVDIGTEKDFTYDVVLADVGGNAWLDVITANSGQANKLYINEDIVDFGEFGGFAAAVVIGDDVDLEKDGSVNLAVADLDGVNGLDIVVGNDALNSNKLYLNDGDGGFASAGIPIGSKEDENGGLDLADVDGDGDIDLLVANKNGSNKLYLNDGSAVFSAAMTVGQEVDESRFIKLVNFDEDAYPEVLVGNYGQTSKHYKQVVYRGHIGRVVSKQVNSDDLVVRTASVAANMNVNDAGTRNTRVDFYLSNNGGSKWYRVKADQEFFFPAIGNDLRWKVELKSRSPVLTPVLDEVVVSRVNSLPQFSVTPSIKGLFAAGKELELINYAATDPEGGDVVVSYQWYSSDKDKIVGAVADTYVLTENDLNKFITVKVSAKDSENGELTVVTKPVSESSFDELGTGESSGADSADADESADDEEEISVIAKRTGGGSLSLLPLLGLQLLFLWRMSAGRRSRRVVAPVFCGHFRV